MTIKNFAQLNDYLKQFIPDSIQDGDFYKPDKMYDLLELVGNPQEKYKVVHVAGTSGKTSTCYYTSAMLASTGSKVGLSVSPHIYEINERLQINNQPLSEMQMCELFNEFISIDGLIDLQPTYFELLVTFAFWVFAEQKCDYAVIEVGLGGLKDATNVIEDPQKVAVITDIGLDHTRILGNTIEQIAGQKAGIIKASNHVFCYEQNNTVDSVIDEHVKKNAATLHRLRQNELAENAQLKTWLPEYQKRNWLLARAVTEFVAERDQLKLYSHKIMQTQETEVPARMQKIQIGSKTLILDGAHNPQKLGALISSLQVLYPGKSVALLAGFVDSKQETLTESIAILREISANVIVTEFTTSSDLPHKTINANHLAAAFERANFTDVLAVADAKKAFAELLQRPEDILLVCGSFYLIGSLWPEVRKYLHA